MMKCSKCGHNQFMVPYVLTSWWWVAVVGFWMVWVAVK